MGLGDERIEVWAQDYSKVLLSTGSRAEAKQFFIDSGQDWLPVRIEWGYGTRDQRWTGRIERDEAGEVVARSEREYLKKVTMPHNPSLT